jgi:hypothetical protein
MTMPSISMLFGFLLAVLGVGGFVYTGNTHFTSLIPAVFGVILYICGRVGLAAPHLRKHVMHVAAAVSLVGLLGVVPRFVGKIPALFAGQPVEPSATAIILQMITAVLLIVFLILCIKSFIDARKARTAA